MITSVKMVGICVSDQARALEFYTQKLGFKVLTDVAMRPKARWLELAPPGAHTRVSLYTPPGLENRIGTFASIVFLCDDVQKTYEELRGRGVEFKQPPETQSWGTMATFLDPDGNTFVLTS